MAKPTDADSSYFPYSGGENPTSTAFLVRLQSGQAEAWKDFMELYVPLIRYWCRRKNVLTRPERQDILQEVLQKVSKSIQQFDHARQERSFRAWLRRITVNQICDYLRGKANDVDASRLYSDPDYLQIPLPTDDEVDPEQEAGEQVVLLRQILKRIEPEFKEKSWDVFHLLFVAEKDSSEVAETLEMKSNAVRQIRLRILKRIREEFAHLGIESDLSEGGASFSH